MSRIEEVLRRASRENLAPTSSANEPRQSSSTAVSTDGLPWDFAEPQDSILVEAAPAFAPAAPVVSAPAVLSTRVDPPPVSVAVAPGDEAAAPGDRLAPLRLAASEDLPLTAVPAEEAAPVASPADVLITRTLRLDAIEQYRKLGAALHEAQLERGMRSLLCTSALMGEGKTVTASNLALTLSESYRRRVLLIDADLRRPQIHAMFGIPNRSGLRDALSAAEDEKLAIQQVTPRLSIVTAGHATSDPMSGLTSARLRHVIDEARNKFDWVIVDTPPVLILPDARVLVSTVDAVLFVVRANSTPFRTVLRAVDVIKRERIFGTVLNSVEETAFGSEYYGYDRYYAAVRPA